MQKPKTPLALILAIAALGGGGWYLAARTAEPPPAAKAEARPQPVLTRAAEARAMPVRVTAVGNVQALSVVPVRTRVEGAVVKVHFAEGLEVAEGDPLFTLDARPAEAIRRQAEAAMARDKAQLDRARAEFTRYSELLKVGSATRQRVEQATADVAVLEAAVKADQAAIETARLSMEYATIKAPVAARTGVINAKLGSLAKPTDAQAMVTLTQLRPITVAFSVAENHLPRIRAAMAAGPLATKVTSTADPGLDATGRLTFIDSAIDVATGTIALKATFANEDTRLWPGQFVNVALTLGTEENALTIPAEAVQTGQSGAYVFAVTPANVAEIRAVTVDRILDGIAVITNGLSAGDKIVVEGQMRLGPGMKVIDKGTEPKPAAKS